MKKKILVFMLLFVFLIGVGVPDQAKAANSTETTADDTKYRDIEDFMHCLGYTDFVTFENQLYTVFLTDSYLEVISFYNIGNCEPMFIYSPGISSNGDFVAVANKDNRIYYHQRYKTPANASSSSDFARVNYTSDSASIQLNYNMQSVVGICLSTEKVPGLLFENLVYSDLDVWYCGDSVSTFVYGNGDLVFESSIMDVYDFSRWCDDSGLNCAASSNEMEDLYNFSFNPEVYYYIVRKDRISGSEYTWYLSKVNINSEHIFYAINRALADSTIGAYNFALDDGTSDYSSTVVNVFNFVYDSSGGGWLFVDRTSTDLGFTNPFYMDDIGISFSSSMPIVYSDVDIYSDKEQSSVYYAASTEYEDSEVTYPDISPTSTPTPTPISNSGSGGTVVGGNAKPGGMLDFLVTLATLVWTELFAVEVPVDGYMISFQQIVIYGAVVGMLIWGGCKLFGKKE